MDPALFDLVQTNIGTVALLLYLAWQIHYGRIATVLDSMEDRIERNTLASRYLARANPNADSDEIDRLLKSDADSRPISDDVIIGPHRDDGRWRDDADE